MGLDCQTCKGAMRVHRGCDEDSPIPGKWNVRGWSFQRCPNKVVKQESFQYIEAYNFFKNGFLPNDGSWQDQSAKLLNAFRIIENEIGRLTKEESKNDK